MAPTLHTHVETSDDGDYYAESDIDIDAYVAALHSEMLDVLGPDPSIRLAVAEHEIHDIVHGMLVLWGVDGVETATGRLRASVDTAERSARGINHDPDMDILDYT